MNVTEANGVDKNVIDLYGNPFYAELAQVVETLRHAPYWHEGEKAPSRLDRARELVRNSRVLLQDERLASVYGSTKAYDVTGFHCTCPQSQKGQSLWCVHSVAVKLARTLVEQASHTPAPVALGTLRPGTLPLPPTTVDARLAQPTPDLPLIAHREEGTAYHTSEGVPYTMDARLALGTIHDSTALATHHTPQEDRMDDHEYLPEPDTDEAPVAVEDEPALLPPAPVKIPREFTVHIKGKVHVLYTGLVLAARANGLVTLSADWTYNDAELSLAHAVCTFADGRRYEESGDASPSNVSKGISVHFRRVALTRAKARCLRDALGISECSVEELAEESGKAPVPDLTPALNEQDLRRRIWQRVKVVAPDVTTKEAVEAVVSMRTGLTLIPDNYRAIIELLERK